MKRYILPGLLAFALAAPLTGCSDPYSPTQRAVGGGLLGAGAGAALGGLAGGGSGALTGGLIGGALGAAAGAVTTPQAPQPRYENSNYPPPPPPYQGYR